MKVIYIFMIFFISINTKRFNTDKARCLLKVMY